MPRIVIIQKFQLINLDRGLFLPPLERPLQGQPQSAHMSKMLHLQDEIMTKARGVLKNTDELHMASFPNKQPTEYLPDNFVILKYRTGSAPNGYILERTIKSN
jgi:hypothetical protein